MVKIKNKKEAYFWITISIIFFSFMIVNPCDWVREIKSYLYSDK